MMVPVLPGILWILAAGFLVLLLLVVFGYHVYQRSRFQALAAEAGDMNRLYAHKERLEAEANETRALLASQKAELLQLEADRHKQELLRADLAHLELILERMKKDRESSLKASTDLDLQLVKKRNLLSRLEAEVKSLEDYRAELGPLDRSVQELRLELEQGKIKAALLAEQELKTATLQQEAYSLERKIEEISMQLTPLQGEKERLHQYIQQARHAATVKNERILEQNKEIRNLENGIAELRRETAELEPLTANLRDEYEATTKEFTEQKSQHEAAIAALGAQERELKACISNLREEAATVRNQLERLAESKESLGGELERLAARKAALELALEETTPAQKPARRRSGKNRLTARSLPKRTGRAYITGKPQQVFCGEASGGGSAAN